MMCESCVDINAVVGREDGYNDYIKRGDLLVAYDKAHRGPPGGARKLIQEAPAEDVAPVVHGRWVYKHRHRGGFRKYTGVDTFGETHTVTVDERFEIDEPYCSECGKWNESAFLNYCPNCGAKMDGG